MVQSVVLAVVRLGWLMKYYNYEFNYGFLSVGLFIFTCYCGGQAWLSAGTWFNDTYVMNCFYQLFFCLSLMSNNVPATTDLLRFWLPAVWTDQVYSSILDLSLKSIWGDSWCRRLMIFLGNFRRRRKRLSAKKHPIFLPSEFVLPVDLSETSPPPYGLKWSTAETKHLVTSIIITHFAPNRNSTEFNTKNGSLAIKSGLIHHRGLSFHLAQHQFPCLIRVTLTVSLVSLPSQEIIGGFHNWTDLG